MIINKEDIENWESKYRLKFVNSLSGYKGVHLIGTKNKKQISNVAIFNSVVHVSSEPGQIGFILRPVTVPRDTYANIIESGFFTINHVHKSFLEQAHFTSAKFPTEESEFKACNLKEEFLNDFYAPFVAESKIKIGLKLVEDIELKHSKCRLLVGEIQFININNDFIEVDGQIDLEKAQDICVNGLNQYSSVKKHKNLPYARVQEKPNFVQKKRPDNVVFDNDTQSYNASLLPYGTNIGAPSINLNSVSLWKSQGINHFNHTLKNKFDNIKDDYERLVKEYKTNELLYQAEFQFEPIIGEVYHLYEKDNKDKSFLSLVPPHTWNRTHLGSYKLGSDKVWVEIKQ